MFHCLMVPQNASESGERIFKIELCLQIYLVSKNLTKCIDICTYHGGTQPWSDLRSAVSSVEASECEWGKPRFACPWVLIPKTVMVWESRISELYKHTTATRASY